MGQDRFDTLEEAEEMRRFRQEGYDQLIAQGFVIAPEPTRYARTVNAVSVPYYADEFSESVAFTCGALPRDLPDDRMLTEVGPALRDAVRALERRTGHPAAMTRRG
jgi:DNA-binding IclR family transcriptional regulator